MPKAALQPAYGCNQKRPLFETFSLFRLFVLSVQWRANKDGGMTVQTTVSDRDRHGRFVTGNNAHRNGATAKAVRLAAKIEELASEYEGGLSALSAADAARLRLAAKHYCTAETTNDSNQCTRSTRAAELLLAKIKPKEPPLRTVQQLIAGVNNHGHE
jgi:hypothetical protein